MAVVQGMRRLKDDGLDKVKQGRTSIAEVARVVNATAARIVVGARHDGGV